MVAKGLILISGDVSTNSGPASRFHTISSANVKSICNKGPLVQSFFRDRHVDCLLLTETHEQEKETDSLLQEIH